MPPTQPFTTESVVHFIEDRTKEMSNPKLAEFLHEAAETLEEMADGLEEEENDG